MPEVVDPEVRQSCFYPELRPRFVNRRVRLLGPAVDKQVIEVILGIQGVQHLDSAVIQGY